MTTGTQPEWYLQRPRTDGIDGAYCFKVYGNASNSSALNVFKSEVDTLKQMEDNFSRLFGLGILNNAIAGIVAAAAIATGGILTGAAIVAIVEALYVTNEVATAAEAVAYKCNDCMYAIEEVYYTTDNMHF